MESTLRAVFPRGPVLNAATQAMGTMSVKVTNNEAEVAVMNGAMSSIASPNWCGAQDKAPMVDVAYRQSCAWPMRTFEVAGRVQPPGDAR